MNDRHIRYALSVTLMLGTMLTAACGDDASEPKTPNTPGMPNNPGEPNTPNNPGEPNTPNNPGEPNTPNNPGEPNTPNNPGEPNNPNNPPPTGNCPAGTEGCAPRAANPACDTGLLALSRPSDDGTGIEIAACIRTCTDDATCAGEGRTKTKCAEVGIDAAAAQPTYVSACVDLESPASGACDFVAAGGRVTGCADGLHCVQPFGCVAADCELSEASPDGNCAGDQFCNPLIGLNLDPAATTGQGLCSPKKLTAGDYCKTDVPNEQCDSTGFLQCLGLQSGTNMGVCLELCIIGDPMAPIEATGCPLTAAVNGGTAARCFQVQEGLGLCSSDCVTTPDSCSDTNRRCFEGGAEEGEMAPSWCFALREPVVAASEVTLGADGRLSVDGPPCGTLGSGDCARGTVCAAVVSETMGNCMPFCNATAAEGQTGCEPFAGTRCYVPPMSMDPANGVCVTDAAPQ